MTFVNKNKSWKTNITSFQDLFKFIVIKVVWYWCEDTQIDQQNKIKSSEIDSYRRIKMVFNNGARIVQSAGKGESFQQMVLEQMNICMQK